MSASLVGSEMCIRDRHGHADRTCLAPPDHPPQEQRHDRVLQSVLGTVSYTHLTLPTICSV
eukprot:7009990-Alexandrium_andersonii.AAC.1